MLKSLKYPFPNSQVLSMICVSVAESTVERCLKTLKNIEFAEIRLDKMKIDKEGVKKIFSKKKRLIATCRPGGKNEKERKELLLSAINAGARYVDIEVDACDDYKKKIAAAAKAKRCAVIISYHNYKKTPLRAELEQIVNWCFESGADIAKIACTVNSNADNARLLGLLDCDKTRYKKIIVIGMGELGKITRIVAPLLGARFTLASVCKGKETAKGQISKDKLEKIIKANKT